MLLLLLACAEAPPVAPPVTQTLRAVSVALNWYPEPEFGGFYEASLSGAYARAGLAVEIVPGGPGAPVLEMLAAGRADVAVSAADDLLIRRARGLDAVAIFPGFQDSPVGLLAHTASGVTRFEDVRGTVAIEVGSPFQQILWAKYGWEGKVNAVPSTGALGAFAADPALLQQGYITSEPCVAEGMGLTVTFLPGAAAGWNPYASLAVVRGGDIAEPWVDAFRNATVDGWNAYLLDPARANTEIARLNPNIPAERMSCIVARQRPFVTGTAGMGAMRAARWEETAAALRSVGLPAEAAGAWLEVPLTALPGQPVSPSTAP